MQLNNYWDFSAKIQQSPVTMTMTNADAQATITTGSMPVRKATDWTACDAASKPENTNDNVTPILYAVTNFAKLGDVTKSRERLEPNGPTMHEGKPMAR